jgi:hypothetical protein
MVEEVDMYWRCRSMLLTSEPWQDPEGFRHLTEYINICERWYPELRQSSNREEFEEKRRRKRSKSRQSQIPTPAPPPIAVKTYQDMEKERLEASERMWCARNIGDIVSQEDRTLLRKVIDQNRYSVHGIIYTEKSMKIAKIERIVPNGILGEVIGSGNIEIVEGDLYAIKSNQDHNSWGTYKVSEFLRIQTMLSVTINNCERVGWIVER